MKLSKYIDHTLLKADATKDQIEKLCNEAIENDFKSVCINPSYIKLARDLLKNSDVLTCTVIGFPLGQMTIESKVFEAKNAVENGAQEVDMVLNIAKVKEGDFDYIVKEVSEIKKAIGTVCLKVIQENCLLTKQQIENASKVCVEAGADFVKTSTGFSTGGATFEDVEIMLKTVNGKAEVKAAGGVRTPEDFQKMIDLGVTRIGTSSGVQLISGQDSKKGEY